MIDEYFETALKLMCGETVSDTDAERLRERNARYLLVKFLYTEKIKSLGIDLIDFHFSPGPDFVKTPMIDIVNSLLKIGESAEIFSFGDTQQTLGKKEQERA